MNPPLLVISPHFGDAVLSVKYVLAASPRSVVATAFTASPPDDLPPQQRDQLAGFTCGAVAMAAHAAEDTAALAVLNCAVLHLGFFADQYRMPKTPRVLTSVLAETITSNHGCSPVGPLGFDDPDHLLAADCFLDAADQLRLERVWLYEEVPFRATGDPTETVATRLAAVRAGGWYAAEAQLDEDRSAAADRAQLAYRSELPLFDADALQTTEKVWMLRR